MLKRPQKLRHCTTIRQWPLKPCFLLTQALSQIAHLQQAQRTQHTLILEYALNYRGLHSMIYKAYALRKGYWVLWADATGVCEADSPLPELRFGV